MIKRINWIFIVAGTFIMMYVMMSTGKSLKTAATPLGIVQLELAYNSTKVAAVLSAWARPSITGLDNIMVATRNTWFDFIFLFFYSLFLFYSCKNIASSFTGLLQKAGNLFAMAALYAGFFDIAENAGMLVSLQGYISDAIAITTATCSTIKWILAIGAVLYMILFGPLYLLKKINKR